jgi:hypothetical protein
MHSPRYPALYQINTRVWLTELSRRLGRPATLDDIPDGEFDQIAAMGFDWVWLLGVWQTGRAGQEVSRANSQWRRGFYAALPDLVEDDIAGSCFAVTGYKVHPALGGSGALARVGSRLQEFGLRLMLDFVPNHTALDHPWVAEHPDYYVSGTDEDIVRAPHNYCRVPTANGPRVLAYGRDPYFPGWADTLQLDYANPAVQRAMIEELTAVSRLCDGVRCDMAMLLLPDVFERTWGRRPTPFWPRAIQHVRREAPEFVFLAEVYWDLEWTLQQQGFDYAYDKRLYDRLRDGEARPVREHLLAPLNYQERLARFLENHDEPRAAATFEPAVHQAAAVVTFLTPGLRFFHQGQLEGRRVHVSPHLVRAPREAADPLLHDFYRRLFNSVLQRDLLRNGSWRLLDCQAAWDGNWTHDCFIAWAWEGRDASPVLAAVNYADHQSQCLVPVPGTELRGHRFRFRDLLGPAVYDRDGDELAGRGLYLDLPAWGHHVFEVTPL